MRGIVRTLFGRGKKNDVITIVSGLPRSGTSLMMQMLEAGGMSAVTDNIRKADEDNPRGYYEFETVKKIKEDTSWLDDCRGKVFKMVSELLQHLPDNQYYKIIFMKRNMNEMLASQRAMLERSGKEGAKVGDEKMAELYEKHLKNVEAWLAKQENIDVIYTSYNDILERTTENVHAVNQFLGSALDEQKMLAVLDESLYRKRREDRIVTKETKGENS